MLIKLFLYIAIWPYCILDFYHTRALIEYGLTEMNPFVRFIIGPEQSWPNLLAYKIFMLTILGIALIADYLINDNC